MDDLGQAVRKVGGWILQVAVGCLAIVVAARVAVPLPGSSVPVTAQTLAVVLAGALCGRYLGTLAVALYLALGAWGLPVFAGGGSGSAALLGPTGGYLMGMLVAAYVTGLAAELGWDRSFPRALGVMIAGHGIVLVWGLFWLNRFAEPGTLWSVGLWPHVPGALIKSAIAALPVPYWRRRFPDWTPRLHKLR